MSNQTTLSDQERDFLAQLTQNPSLANQQLLQLVQELTRSLQLVQELTRSLRLPIQSPSPYATRKPAEELSSPEVLAEEKENTLSLEELKAQGQQLEQLYALHNPEQIWQFLMTHQYLLPLLIKAHSSVRKYFPTNDLVIAHTTDPDIPELEDLTLYISYDPDWRKSREALNQFDREWWPIAGDRADEDLCITLGGI